jgi:hypothetical protein
MDSKTDVIGLTVDPNCNLEIVNNDKTKPLADLEIYVNEDDITKMTPT